MSADAVPFSGSSDHEKYAAGYAAVAVATACTALPLIFQPRTAAEFLLGATALPINVDQDRLMGIAAGGMLAASAASWALKTDADSGDLDSGSSETLQLGLIGFAATNLAAHLAHMNDLTPNGLAAGLATSVVAAAVPTARLVFSPKGRSRLVDRIKSTVESLTRSFDFGNRGRGFKLTSALYGVLVPATLALGITIAAAPAKATERIMGQPFVGADTSFFVRQISASTMAAVPAMLLVLKDKSDDNKLGDAQSRVLNAGLLLNAVVKLSVLAPMLVNNEGGNHLPAAMAVTVGVALASTLGLTGCCANV